MAFLKPNLFVIGAMKSGTTYLSVLLNSHPSIFICYPEEPSYFVDAKQLRKIWPYMWEFGYWRSLEHYLQLFDSAGDAAVIGEASTNYSKLRLVAGVPQRILKFNPGSRFIYLMRDPVERTISHYWHMVLYHSEHRPMLSAIWKDSQFCDVSYYAMQLKAYIDLFGRDRIKIVTYEELTRNPHNTIRNLYEWLGVDCLFIPPGISQPENVTPLEVERARGRGVLERFRRSAFWSAVSPHVPRALRSVARPLALRKVNRRSVSLAEVIRYLRAIQRKQTEELIQLLGRDFSQWTTLYGEDGERA